jgi:hypothetical protein
VLTHSPAFVFSYGAAMIAHTFRGSSIRSLLGLESERAAFARFRAIRREEREYLPDVDPDGGLAPAPVAVSSRFGKGGHACAK